MSTSIRLFVIALLVATAPAPGQEPVENKEEWLIVPGKGFGAITGDSTEAQLVEVFGRDNVKAEEIFAGDGETELGTVVYPEDPLRRVEILWKDPKAKRFPFRIQIRGEKSLWHTKKGVSLGTTLLELEKINGRPFEISGFGWDSGGQVNSWEGGALEQAFEGKGKGHLFVFLAPPDWENTGLTLEEERAVSGERGRPSDHPVMRKMNLRVSEMLLVFYEN